MNKYNKHSTYSRRRKPALPGASIFSVLLLVLLLVLFIFDRTAAQGLLWRAAAPVTSIGQRIAGGLSVLALPFTSKAALIAENTALHAELAQAQSEVQDHDALAEENKQLKASLGRPDAPARTLASITARPPQVPYDTFVLDAGMTAGVETGDLISSGSVALGTVMQSAPYNSQAALFSSPGQTTSAFLNNSVPVTLLGQGGGSFIARVPQGTLAAPGDSAMLPGIWGEVVATVSYVNNPSGNQIFKELYLTTPVSLFDMQTIEIWHEALPSAISTSTPTFPSTKKNGA